MRRVLPVLVFLALAQSPVLADEVADALREALRAYELGDVAVAREEAEYAVQLLAQQKAEGLTVFLPQALPGWSRAVGEGQAHTGAMFGVGLTASATYIGPDGQQFEIQLLADSPIAAMFANPAMMGAFGQVRRINRVNFAVDPQGDIQGMVGKVLVQVSGSASVADKTAYLEKMDLRALAAY